MGKAGHVSRPDVVERTDESARLRALYALQVLDTPREERFDRLVELVKELIHVPMAAVTLVDEDRLWAKASTGLPSDQMPRRDSVCTVTIQRDEPLVVSDLMSDDRFKASPFLAGSGVRFYAGQPLHAGEHRIGVLCVMGYEERQLDAGELRLLRTLADWVEVELATGHELHRAALVQRALRPRSVIRLAGLEVAGRCVTARQLGGDFYDWFIARDRLHIFAGDVMGKGIGAALIASSVRAVLRGAARFISIEEAFNRTAYDLDQDLGDTSTFVTAFGACIDPETGRGQYVDAGHGLAVVIDSEGVPRRLTSGGLPIGAISGDHWVAHDFVLEPGDALVVVSDGILDYFDNPDEGLEALSELGDRGLGAQQLVDEITAYADRSRPADDVTVVVVKRSVG